MRILRGRDYYDSALAYGADQETVFVRDSIVLKDEKEFKDRYGDTLTAAYCPFGFKPKKEQKWKFRRGKRSNEIYYEKGGDRYEVTFEAITVFVAGKRYHGLEAHESSNTAFPPIRHVFWSAETLKQYVEAFEYEITTTGWYMWRDHDKDRSPDTFFNPVTTERDYDFLVNNRISILTYGSPNHFRSPVWTVNGDDLGHFGFAKRVDPYQLFQELSMWVSGVIPKDGPPMVEITDDKIKAAKHGMDRWSFRRTNEHKPNS